MDWYYAQQHEKQGPISDVELTGLATAGIITDRTLVWRDGMAAWQPYGEMRAGLPPPAAPPVVTLSPVGPDRAAHAERGWLLSKDQRVACPRCRTPLRLAQLNTGLPEVCPGCRTPTLVDVFPALLRPLPTGAQAETIVVEGEASCFYHPQKRAAAHCTSCGRFLCALCDIELNGRHLCPGCLETGQRKGNLSELENRRTLYDSAALSVALVGPILTCFVGSIVTAPVAIGLALWSWKRPGSILPRTHLRSVLAIGLGVLEVGAWALWLLSLAYGA
jgi:hypothetical protein